MVNFGITQQKKHELALRMDKCNLLENDIEEKFVRSRGPGGQKVNKSSTCVHLRHICSGLSVKVQKSRSQGLNRYYARKQMCELLENKLPGKESKSGAAVVCAAYPGGSFIVLLREAVGLFFSGSLLLVLLLVGRGL